MLSLRKYRVFALIVGGLATSACADNIATDPLVPGVAAQSSLKGSLPDLAGAAKDAADLSLHALWWNKDQKKDVRVSQTIDVKGGTITLAATGLTLSFPPGAVAKPITITITPDKKYVAYKMEPSGTQFLKDVTATQQLNATTIYGEPLRSQIFAAYIADDKLKLSGSVPVIEIEPSYTIFSPTSPRLPVAHVWIIKHFSRYMLASG